MYESEYSPAVRDFITWLEANSDNPEAEIEAVKSGANIAVENTTGSDDDFDNGLEEVTNEWEAAPGLAPKLAEIAYNAQWDTSLCHTAEFFVDREEFNDNGDRLEYTKTSKMQPKYSTTTPEYGIMQPGHGRKNNMETYTIQHIIDVLQQEIDNGTDPETKITFGSIQGHPQHRDETPKIEPHPLNNNELILYT